MPKALNWWWPDENSQVHDVRDFHHVTGDQ
jgi:hypothetical protein